MCLHGHCVDAAGQSSAGGVRYERHQRRNNEQRAAMSQSVSLVGCVQSSCVFAR